MPLHPDRKRLKTQIQHIGVHRRLDAAEIAHELGGRLRDECALVPKLRGVCDSVVALVWRAESWELVLVRHPVEFSVVYDAASERRVVAVHVLGRGVHYDVGSELERAAVDWGSESVVDDERDSVRVRGFRETLDVEHDEGRVRDCLSEDGLRVRFESRLKFLVRAVRVHESEIDAHLLHRDAEKLKLPP